MTLNKLTPVAYGYARVSTVEQAVNGMSIEEQPIRCKKYFDGIIAPTAPTPILWGDVFIDAGVSAAKHKLRDRKAGRELFLILRPGDHVIMTQLSRGFRNFRDCLDTVEKWIADGINVHFMDMGIASTTHGGRFLLRIFAAIAEMQREMLSEGIKAAIQRRRETVGVVNGRCKAGFKIEGRGRSQRIVPDEHDRACAALAIEMRGPKLRRTRTINTPTRATIVEIFAKHGVLTSKGKPWGIERLNDIMARYVQEGWNTPPLVMGPPLPPPPPKVKRVREPRSGPKVNILPPAEPTTATPLSIPPDAFYSGTWGKDSTTISPATASSSMEPKSLPPLSLDPRPQ